MGFDFKVSSHFCTLAMLTCELVDFGCNGQEYFMCSAHNYDGKDCQLQEFPVNEKEALKQLNVVTISRREVELVGGCVWCMWLAMLLNVLLEDGRDGVWREETDQSIKEQTSWETGKSL